MSPRARIALLVGLLLAVVTVQALADFRVLPPSGVGPPGPAGGAVPTGTGFTHITAGVQDAAAKLVDTADINNDQVTLAKLADIATARFLGRTTAGTGDPEALTGTQATALLDAFTSGLKGLAPASGGGTTNFLRADGTWAAPAGGGTPGGADTQVQFNDAGAFGGDAGLVYNKTTDLLTATDLTLALGTITADNALLDTSATWNAAGILGPAWLLNVTDTSSNAAALLMDLRVGGVSKWNVDKTGKVTQTGPILVPDGTSATPAYSFGGSANSGVYRNVNGRIGHSAFGVVGTATGSAGVIVASTGALYWASTSDPVTDATLGLRLFRDADGILAQRNGTNAQEGRTYNLDSGANDEYFTIDWKTTANRLTIGPKNTGTGTLRDMTVDFGSGVAFASLGAPKNGVTVYCSDCTVANPCASGGSGAIADRINGAWVCNAGGSGSPGGSTTQIQFNDAGAFGGDAAFVWDKTNDILSLATTARIYQTAIDTTNFERISIGCASNICSVLSEKGGTGNNTDLRVGTDTTAVLRLRTGGTDRWQIDSVGSIQALTHNTYDIGSGGADPRSIYAATSMRGGFLQSGSAAALTLSAGEIGMLKSTATTAPGAAGGKLVMACGTNAGTGKLVFYAGTSATPVTVVDNVGTGVTGC